MLQSMGSQRVGHNWAIEQQQQYSIASMCHIYFIRSSFDGHFCCFYIVAVVNKEHGCTNISGVAAFNTFGHLSSYCWIIW